MSNLDPNPEPTLCAEHTDQPAGNRTPDADPAPQITVISPREVPLGGLRAMSVRRTLPAKERTLIGAWCFVDHYGPDLVSETGGMSVVSHPHTGLQTVSWLFTGTIDHTDSAGHAAEVRPGEVNLMTAGSGINHSELTGAATTILHGAQLWVALPEEHRHTAPAFENYRAECFTHEGAQIRVFLGSLGLPEETSPHSADDVAPGADPAALASPVRTFTELLGAEILLPAGGRLTLPVKPGHEHGVLVDAGSVEFCGTQVEPGQLAVADLGLEKLTLAAGEEPVRLLLLGGEPLNEEILMWWNFIGRTHEEVAGYREEWQQTVEAWKAGSPLEGSRYGVPVTEGIIPAPELPGVKLRTRGNRER